MRNVGVRRDSQPPFVSNPISRCSHSIGSLIARGIPGNVFSSCAIRTTGNVPHRYRCARYAKHARNPHRAAVSIVGSTCMTESTSMAASCEVSHSRFSSIRGRSSSSLLMGWSAEESTNRGGAKVATASYTASCEGQESTYVGVEGQVPAPSSLMRASRWSCRDILSRVVYVRSMNSDSGRMIGVSRNPWMCWETWDAYIPILFALSTITRHYRHQQPFVRHQILMRTGADRRIGSRVIGKDGLGGVLEKRRPHIRLLAPRAGSWPVELPVV